MVMLGANPAGRTIEQHDMFFGIADEIKALKEDMYAFWPNAGQLHGDSWRRVTKVGDFKITIVPKHEATEQELKLFFLNLGGYLPDDLEEYHYKVLVVARTMAEAVKAAKKTTFYKHYGFKGAESHIDEKYALDVDDMHKVEDLLPESAKDKYHIQITPALGEPEDALHVGYVKLGAR